jgi:two-component system CitB family sensor kinase
VAEDIAGNIFTEGFSTKTSNGRRPRGLGLALVMQVVRRHAGDISLQQEGGTTFRVTLPLRARAGARP